MQRGDILAVLLCGGDKRTQDADIKRAIKMRRTGRGDVWPLSDGRKKPFPDGMPPTI
jgi:hypothetical protein